MHWNNGKMHCDIIFNRPIQVTGLGVGAIAFFLNFLYSKLEGMEKTAYAGPTR